jgi:hypothetical protein
MGLSMEWHGDPRRTEKVEGGSPAQSVR